MMGRVREMFCFNRKAKKKSTGDTVEVIRCRDCKFFDPCSYVPDDYPELALNTCKLHGEVAQNSGYCSWAVRKDV